MYAHGSKEAAQVVGKVQRGHHPASVIVWWGLSYHGVTKLNFCEKGVKTSAKVYQETVLDRVVKPFSNTLFKNVPWTFQQDSAPGHKAQTTHAGLKPTFRTL